MSIFAQLFGLFVITYLPKPPLVAINYKMILVRGVFGDLSKWQNPTTSGTPEVPQTLKNASKFGGPKLLSKIDQNSTKNPKNPDFDPHPPLFGSKVGRLKPLAS